MPPQVEKRFPDKEAKLMIACSNGTQYSISALEALDEAGYINLIGLKGGFRSWFRCGSAVFIAYCVCCWARV